MGQTKRANYKVFNGTDWDTINFASDGDNSDIYKQAFINGNFDVWQRGTVFTNPAQNSYTADRWCYWKDGTVSSSISRMDFVLGSNEIYPTVPNYFIKHQVTAISGTTGLSLIQQIENGTIIFSGQKVTVSFWARSDSAGRVLGVSLRQHFGTGSGASPQVDYDTSVILTTSFAKYSVTFDLANIYGKVLGSNNDPRLMLFFRYPITTHVIDIAQVQLNAGAYALPFSPKTYDQELRDCMRYYQKGIFTFIANSMTNLNCLNTTLQVPMRNDNWLISKHGTDLAMTDSKFYDRNNSNLSGACSLTGKDSKTGWFNSLNVDTGANLTTDHIYITYMALDCEL